MCFKLNNKKYFILYFIKYVFIFKITQNFVAVRFWDMRKRMVKCYVLGVSLDRCEMLTT